MAIDGVKLETVHLWESECLTAGRKLQMRQEALPHNAVLILLASLALP